MASLVITALLGLCAVDDFLSLHDIKADYVSTAALEYLHLTTSGALAPWTDARLEWASVTVSYVLRWLLILSNAAILILLLTRPQQAGGALAGQEER
jgi:hypothetical protein